MPSCGYQLSHGGHVYHVCPLIYTTQAGGGGVSHNYGGEKPCSQNTQD